MEGKQGLIIKHKSPEITYYLALLLSEYCIPIKWEESQASRHGKFA